MYEYFTIHRRLEISVAENFGGWEFALCNNYLITFVKILSILSI